MSGGLENTIIPEVDKHLSVLKKVGCAVSGPVVGLLPPRVQINSLGYQGASIASTSSRIFDDVWSVYAVVSLVVKVFGVDIDPTTHDPITYVGIPIALDSGIREFLFGVHSYLTSPFNDNTEPWGEPIISFIDGERHPEFYGKR